MSTEFYLMVLLFLAGMIAGFLGAAYLVKYLLSKRGGWKFTSPEEYTKISLRYSCPICGETLKTIDHQQKCPDEKCAWSGAAVYDGTVIPSA